MVKIETFTNDFGPFGPQHIFHISEHGDTKVKSDTYF